MTPPRTLPLLPLLLFINSCTVKTMEPAPEVGVPVLLQAPVERVASLSGLRPNVVVLEFWATWCGPCRETLPHMNKMVERFKDRPVRFISVTDEDEGTVRAFLKDYPMRAWVGLDRDRLLFDAFRVRGVPQVVVIDPYGRIQVKVTTSFFYASDVERALKARPAAGP